MIKRISIILLIIISSCKEKIASPKPEELYERYEKSVVLIRNDYYFEITLNNGIKIYFTDISNDSFVNFTFKEDEIFDKTNTIYGTGFFVSKEGLIATNKHVAQPYIDETNVLNCLKLRFEEDIQSFEMNVNKRKREIDEIDNLLYYYYGRLSYSDINHLRDRRQELNNERMFWTELSTKFNFDQNKSSVRCISHKLSIAYNNTYVTNKNDFKDCVFKSKSEEPDIDLALIQLKDKTTPSFVKNIFDFKDHNPNIENGTIEDDEKFDINSQVRIDKKVYMIGFNYGINIAITEDGLKSQLTQGTVSQESDKKKVLYSIPSLEGSSGSPVIDEWGNIVAINFAKISGTQNFNYGILSKHLKELIEKH